MPPDAEAMNEIDPPASGAEGLNEKLADNGAGLTVTDCCELAVCCGEPASFTVDVTVNVPTVE